MSQLSVMRVLYIPFQEKTKIKDIYEAQILAVMFLNM